MITFYIISKRFFLKREGLSNAKVASITKKEYDFALKKYGFAFFSNKKFSY